MQSTRFKLNTTGKLVQITQDHEYSGDGGMCSVCGDFKYNHVDHGGLGTQAHVIDDAAPWRVENMNLFGCPCQMQWHYYHGQNCERLHQPY